MEDLNKDLNKIRDVYRDVFEHSKNAIDSQLEALKKTVICNHCRENCDISFSSAELFQMYPVDCCYRLWQKAALNKLKGQISKDIYEKIQQMNNKRQNYNCQRCASCCRLASSEFTYEELKEKAKNGDKFAKEFTSIFIPYDSDEIPRKIYPEYVALLKEKFDEEIQFYHCPKVSEAGLCMDYENRPSICRSFPDNPLAALPPKCGYRAWKDDVEIIALMLHAMVEIVGFYITKLEYLLSE